MYAPKCERVCVCFNLAQTHEQASRWPGSNHLKTRQGAKAHNQLPSNFQLPPPCPVASLRFPETFSRKRTARSGGTIKFTFEMAHRSGTSATHWCGHISLGYNDPHFDRTTPPRSYALPSPGSTAAACSGFRGRNGNRI